MPANNTLTYCSDPEAGIVNYTTCISEADETVQAADERAFNQSKTMPRFSDDGSCIRAQKRLLCGLFFPKCNNSDTNGIRAQILCNPTCVNFFRACNVALTTLCDDRAAPSGTPSWNCTGLGAMAAVPGLVGIVALLMVMMLLL